MPTGGQVNETGIISNVQASNQTQIVDQGTIATGSEQPLTAPSVGQGTTPDAGLVASSQTASPVVNGNVAGPSPVTDVVTAPGTEVPAVVPGADPVGAGPALPPSPQPVANSGVVGSDGDPTRAATRYAMVKADGTAALTLVGIALGGGLLAAFFCLLLLAPEASVQRKPRPKGAY